MTESLYAVLFSDSLVKVGRAVNPARRITQHKGHVAVVGLTLAGSHAAACVGPAKLAERELIERCHAAASGRIGMEWFRGLDFDAVSAWLDECAALPAPAVEPLSATCSAGAIPSAASVRESLLSLGHAQMQVLARRSRVPFTTLWKVRDGTTKNPGLATVGKFIGLLSQLRAAA